MGVLYCSLPPGCGTNDDASSASDLDSGVPNDAAPDGPGIDAPAGCDLTKDPKDSPACIDDGVGIFVDGAKGVDSAAGTKAAPVKTIGAAIGKAGQKRVYVCEGTYAEEIEVKGPVSIYGGLGCGTWSPSSTKPKVAPSKGVAMRVTKVTGPVLVQDLEVVGSADGASAGDSAVAVLVSESADVTFRGALLSAGAGVAGAKGASRSNYSGANATKGGNASGGNGGAGPTCTCVDASSSTGGNGGAGGGGGLTDGSANPTVGVPNSGASKATSCDPGLDGANGPMASPTQAATKNGALSSSGWTSAAANAAAPNGKPAQGGGGGGTKLDSASPGGGGGCGGCGGAGGEAGGAGGSSFALLSFMSSIKLVRSTLNAGAGGVGGVGGDGQDGQGGGGAGTGVACNGGIGGHGSGGSGGSGGAGGNSAAVGFVGNEPKNDGSTLTPGSKGTGGEPGQAGAGPGAAGAGGVKGSEGKSGAALQL